MEHKTDNLIGKKVGLWTVLKRDPEKHKGGIYYICRCECGTVRQVVANSLRKETSWHCGCQFAKVRKEAVKKQAQRRLNGEYKKKPVDIVGKRFGRLLVLEQLDEGFATKSRFRCHCDCGNEIIKSYQLLRAGTRSCGCLNRERRLDIGGKKFGKLTAVEYIESEEIEALVPESMRKKKSDGKYCGMWKCQCDCGNTVYTIASALNDGNIKSCGCANKRTDITGQRFGRLVALDELPFSDPFYDKFKKKHTVYWRCRCDCGNETFATYSMLKNGWKLSCGCYYADKAVTTMKVAHAVRRNIEDTNIDSIQSALNGKVSKANSTGVRGVSKKADGKYTAQIGFKKKTYHLGTFEKLDDARDARKKAEQILYGEFMEHFEKDLKESYEAEAAMKKEEALKELREFCKREHAKGAVQ